MADVVDDATRSRMMAGIRSKNTRPEISLRKALHREGYRYGLHCQDIPGKPDLVFRSRRAVIFVHGCFWHGHDCQLFRLPATRTAYWEKKISANRSRDKAIGEGLAKSGWRQLIVWECAMRGKGADNLEALANRAIRWLESGGRSKEIRGRKWR